jgi:hypothetical protein
MTMILPNRRAPAHDELVCGIDEPGFPPRCPGCRWEQQQQRPPDADDDAWLLRESLGLPRNPRLLTRQQFTDFTLFLLDLLLTVDRKREWGESLRAIAGNILGEGGSR